MTAPRITTDHLNLILQQSVARYVRIPETTVTICCITLPSGFSLVGHSACVSEENFDADIGNKLAYEKASEKLWELEGYRLCVEVAEKAGRKAEDDK